MDLRVISIGAMAAHPLWNERAPVRTGHATTTLIRSGDAVILVDPGLPAQALVARLAERAGIAPRDVTHVFLTSFRPDVRRAVEAFDDATWWIGETERELVGVPLARRLREAAEFEGPTPEEGGPDLRRALEHEVAVLNRCTPAPDHLAPQVDLFPLPGVTPGLCGLLIAAPRHTTVVCGDAIPTVEHLEAAMVPPGAADVARAQESFREAVEIADVLVLGRDNLVMNPLARA